MLDRDQIAEVYARAREAEIAAVAGTPLARAGRRLRGECPLCGASKGKKASGAFSCEPQARMFYCFGCLVGGDVIDLEQRLRGGTGLEAAVRLAGMPVPTSRPAGLPRAARRQAETVEISAAERIGRAIWQDTDVTDLGFTPAGLYLAGRGIGRGPIAGVGRRLRFAQLAKWGWDDARGTWTCAPAIVGQVASAGGPTGGVHVTYLDRSCRARARLDPAKRMWGPQKDPAGRPGGVWLTAQDAPGPLIVGEGIESTLSAMQLYAAPCRGVAALSLGALQGGWLSDAWGRIDPACVAPDPERPAFTWPDQGEVIVAVDRDMSPITVKVRKAGGGTVSHVLDAEARAKICAGLATAAWRAAGANVVRAIAPAAGRDFNDELRERVG